MEWNKKMKPKLKEIIDETELLEEVPQRRGIIHNLMKYIVRTGKFYENSTTYKAKEQDNDYEKDKYGTEMLG